MTDPPSFRVKNRFPLTSMEAVIPDPNNASVIELAKLFAALKEFEELEVGDVLSFDPPELAEVIVNDFPLFNAQVGTSGSKVAIKIVESALGSEG